MSANDARGATTCPECGEVAIAGKNKCWLCGAALGARAGHAQQRLGTSSAVAGALQSDTQVLVVLVILTVLVCVGLMFEQPGIGILLAIVATPALVRTAVATARQRERGRPVTVGDSLLAFLGSLGVVVAVGTAAVVAFFATCFAVCLGGSSVLNTGPGRGGDSGMIASIAAGGVISLALAIFLFWKFWPRKN